MAQKKDENLVMGGAVLFIAILVICLAIRSSGRDESTSRSVPEVAYKPKEPKFEFRNRWTKEGGIVSEEVAEALREIYPTRDWEMKRVK
jgi:hypothetical protein